MSKKSKREWFANKMKNETKEKYGNKIGKKVAEAILKGRNYRIPQEQKRSKSATSRKGAGKRDEKRRPPNIR